jgi:hypothetical protein
VFSFAKELKVEQRPLQEHYNQEMIKILSLDYTFRQAVQSNNVEAAARIAVQSLHKVQCSFCSLWLFEYFAAQ